MPAKYDHNGISKRNWIIFRLEKMSRSIFPKINNTKVFSHFLILLCLKSSACIVEIFIILELKGKYIKEGIFVDLLLNQLKCPALGLELKKN